MGAVAKPMPALSVLAPLTTPDFVTLSRYVRVYSNAVGLRDWEFEIMHAPPDEAFAYVKVDVHEHRKYAALWFCIEFRRLAAEFQRHCIIHELVHVHLAEMGFVFRSIREDLGRIHFEALDGSYLRAEEKAVDALTGVIAPALPVIDWRA
jgi:hypothetical protein